jgi:hypothetical protein
MTDILDTKGFTIEFDGTDCFISIDGAGRIAKREAKMWKPLQKGWVVESSDDFSEITVTHYYDDQIN